jgi:hypothetical protein
MKRLTFLGILVCVALLVAAASVVGAAPPPGIVGKVTVVNTPLPVTTGYRFVGFSTATTNGNAGGLLRMNEICGWDWPGSRLCTTHEYILSAPYGPMPGELQHAWIIPSFVTVVLQEQGYAGQGAVYCVDKSGWGWRETIPFWSNDSLGTCHQWTSDSSTLVGLSVASATGTISSAGCNNSLHCACCLFGQVP